MSPDRKNEPKAVSFGSTDYNEDTWVPKIKRRRRFTVEETRILENEFKRNSSPNQEKIQSIANLISTPRKIVTTWFQNRRAKNKRKEKLQREESISTDKKSDDSEFSASPSIGFPLPADEDEDSSFGEGESCQSNYIDSRSSEEVIIAGSESSSITYGYYTTNQQDLSSSSDDVNLELALDDATVMVAPPFHAANSFHHHRQIHYNSSSAQNNMYTHSTNFVNNTVPLSPNNQLYNINIYNNMNNFFIPQEQQYNNGDMNEIMISRNNNSIVSQQQLFNMICYQQQQQQQQQQFSPFYTNNYNFPSPLLSTSAESDPICINPADLYLDFPQYRYQQYKKQREEQGTEDDDE